MSQPISITIRMSKGEYKQLKNVANNKSKLSQREVLMLGVGLATKGVSDETRSRLDENVSCIEETAAQEE